MSYTAKVKEELAGHISKAQHCRIAEIAAIISMCGNIIITANDTYVIKVYSENISVASKFYDLIKKTFKINAEISIRCRCGSNTKKIKTYTIVVKKNEDSVKILQATKLMDHYGNIEENMSIKDNIVIMKNCCKRAFVRGAFLSTGSVMDPNKSYHLEIVCNCEAKAQQIVDILGIFNIDGKTVARKGYFVVYIKEGEQIVDVLNVMEAHNTLLEYENTRILKDMSNNCNRQNNCEIANIKKTVTTAHRQIEAIRFIEDTVGLDYLPENLQEIAKVRTDNPDVPLKDLGELLSKPIGKSGVNHRLRKICEIAENIKNDDV
ncbi:MAG: DNA-binding protein WhiA [Lachnospiraceae bacterium]|nr:DNA-binding protein WhiA [Lachnospiraceae bacterium]